MLRKSNILLYHEHGLKLDPVVVKVMLPKYLMGVECNFLLELKSEAMRNQLHTVHLHLQTTTKLPNWPSFCYLPLHT